mgnify:CR=1 FL=1
MWKKALFGVCAVLLCALFITVPHAYAADQITSAEKPKRIELVLVIDKSGSMGGLESDTIGGFNSMVEKQRALHIPVLFNDEVQTLYDRKAIWRVPPLTDHDYVTGGTTALLDAVGTTIRRMERADGITAPGTKVVFVIITDGLENASTEFTRAAVKRMISDKQEMDGWSFIYLGANIDAAEEAGAIGVDRENAVTYSNTHTGVRANYDAVSAYVKEAAEESGAERGAWKRHVEQDAAK